MYYDVCMLPRVYRYSYGLALWLRGLPYMTSDGSGEGGSTKSDFITIGSLIKHLMRGVGGQKGKNHLTSYMT